MSNEPALWGDAWIAYMVGRYEGPLVRYAARIVGDADSARDVVQETFLRLCRERPADLDGHLAQWLFTVCRNQALDVCRKENRMTSISMAAAEACASREPSQAAVIEGQDTTGAVLQILATLPADQQEVVRLKFQNGLSYREISQVTGLTVTNVGYLLHTAIGKLRTQLSDQDLRASER